MKTTLLMISLLLLGCGNEPISFNKKRTDELGETLSKDLRFMRLPQTNRCYAYAWLSKINGDNGSAVVFEVPCEGVTLTYPCKPNTAEAGQ